MPRVSGCRTNGQETRQWFVAVDDLGRRRHRCGLMLPIFLMVAAVVLAGGLALRSVQESSGHAPSGAIFTTKADGVPVNANIYSNKHNVHLNGGPPLSAPPGAAGLDDGDYYFQVTDPSGAVLLSSDPLQCRRIRVADGVIKGSVNLDGSLNNTSVGLNSNSTPCPHHVHTDGTKPAALNARTVHLMPYVDTPNPGGVYKVWVMEVAHLPAGCDPTQVDCTALQGGGRFHGFIPAFSKTDNFKVKGVPFVLRGSISGVKWYDANNDGVLDPTETGIPGWPIKVCNVGPITQTSGNSFNIPNVGDCTTLFTDSNGAYTLINLRGSTYCVREARARDLDTDPADPTFNTFDWEQTFPTAHSTSVLFAVGCTHDDPGFDADLMNGIHVVTLLAGQAVIDINFGNVAFELVPFVGGLTWGYWKTHTGTAASPPKAPQDPIYTSTPFTTSGIDIGTSSGTHLHIDTPEEADLVFAADGSAGEPSQPLPGEIQDLCSVLSDCRGDEFEPPADCSGDCHELLAAQLLALELNCLKFTSPSMCAALFISPGDPLSGSSVSAIIAIADAALTSWFNGGSCSASGLTCNQLLNTIDLINSNATTGVLFTLVPLPSPPSPLCFVGFPCP